MSKFTPRDNYVYGNEEAVYIATEYSDARKIAELMNLLDKSIVGGYDHPTVFEQRYLPGASCVQGDCNVTEKEVLDHSHQRKDFPLNSTVVAKMNILGGRSHQDGKQIIIPKDSYGEVVDHCIDGRAIIEFEADRNAPRPGHTFSSPEDFIKRGPPTRAELLAGLRAAIDALEFAQGHYFPGESDVAAVWAYVNGYEGSPDIRALADGLADDTPAQGVE